MITALELKKRVQRYLDEERTVILKRRVSAILQELLDTATTMYRTVSSRYPEDPAQAMRAQQEERNILFSQWWREHWRHIEANVNNRFKDRLNAFLAANKDVTETTTLNKRYADLVKDTFSSLPARQTDEIQIIFDGIRPTFDPAKANALWRERLYVDIRKAINTISRDLTIELKVEALSLIEDIRAQLWGAPIETRLIEPNFTEFLERSLTTLFLRFARPVAELLVRGALGSDTREDLRARLGPDIEIIDNYYRGHEPALKYLKRYVNHGAALLNDSEKRQEILGEGVELANFDLKRHPLARALCEDTTGTEREDNSITKAKAVTTGDFAKRCEVIDEVEYDLQVLEHYLLNGIFEAAGLLQFAEQELENLRENFLSSEWGGLVRNEWENGNPLLLRELPVELQKLEFDTEISDKLKQLGVALRSNPQHLQMTI